MKTWFVSLSLLLFAERLVAGGLTLPPPENDPNLPAPPATTVYTAEELAVPPSGQIQRSLLRTVNSLRSELGSVLAAVPVGPDGQGSSLFTSAQTFKTGLDTLSASCLQTDCFALIAPMAALAATGGQDVPDFVQTSRSCANEFREVLLHAMERHIIDNNATVTGANLERFIIAQSMAGGSNSSEEGWDATLDPAGVFILDPVAAVVWLKTRPWQDGNRFVRKMSATDAFKRYGSSGDGLAPLKTKYSATRATVDAKWAQLSEWVEESKSN